MTIGRTLPPAAAPVCLRDLGYGIRGILRPGSEASAREEEVRRYFGVNHVFLVSSGTAALTLTLLALKTLSRKTDVVIPAYTCFSVPAAVLKAGLRPVLCDITLPTFDYDYAQLERSLSENTLCVVAHHLFGIASDIDRIKALCHPRAIVVLEDAAQAMGGQSDDRLLGTRGDVGIFSLGRGKNITCGSGGIIVTSSDRIAAAIEPMYRRLANSSVVETLKDLAQIALMAVFIRPRLYWIPARLPFLKLGQTIFPKTISMKRLSGFKAGLLHRWKDRLRVSDRFRAKAAAHFGGQLAIPLPPGPPRPYLRLPIFAPTPDAKQRLCASSQGRRLGLSAAYPTPVSDIPQIRSITRGEHFPIAQTVASTMVTLPTHHWVSERDREDIVDLVSRFTNTPGEAVVWRRAS